MRALIHIPRTHNGPRHGPRIGRTHELPAAKLEISRSATSPVEAPQCLDAILTQEELSAEPESGFEGSSTVESTWMTRMSSGTGLLCTSLMLGIGNVLGRAAKAGRGPVLMIRGPPERSTLNGCLAGGCGMPSSHPPN